MQRIAYPECDCCGSARPEYESTQWNLRVCYACLRMVADWLDANDLLIPNPLVEELFDGVFSGGTVPTSQQYTVVVQSKLAANAFSYKLLTRVQSDGKESS
jgi:hypothetical protein